MGFIALVLVLAIAALAFYYFFIYKKQQDVPAGDTGDNTQTPDNPANPSNPGGDDHEDIESGELSIHFLELGNKYVGDCTLIKIGDTEVLIDAGSKQESASVIVPYVQQYCTDNVLEYIIATHAHEDHIGAFYSTKERKGIFESFECGTIIDFPLTRKNNSPTTVYGRYCNARDAEVEEGATHYTALQCWNNADGAQRSYELAEGVTLNILYQKYYEEYDTNKSAENNYSVCVMVTQGKNNYLFTGDLEKKGEESLVEKNELPHCKLYKGGHHGSSTSSNEVLLSAISPEVICICTCAGTPEYADTNEAAFPTQECIDRMAKYTDQIYVTSIATGVDWTEKRKWTGAESLNGNIVVKCNGKDFSVTGSNNSTILKETAWFKENRTWNGA